MAPAVVVVVECRVMNKEQVKHRWDRNGYFVVPRLFDLSSVKELRKICNRVLGQWLNESRDPRASSDLINMAYLTEPRYFEDHPAQLTTLLEAVADEKILSLLEAVFDAELLFHNTQYFFDPRGQSRAGAWHRDQQFVAEDDATEELIRRTTVGVHVHVAFLPDDNLEIVPGSHTRRDTPEELRIRRGLNGRETSADDMPGAVRISLGAGDACFFSAWSIHRGRYLAEHPRRTFDIIYGTSNQWAVPPPTCFLRPDVLRGVSEPARRFFRRFIDAYKPAWEKGEYDS